MLPEAALVRLVAGLMPRWLATSAPIAGKSEAGGGGLSLASWGVGRSAAGLGEYSFPGIRIVFIRGRGDFGRREQPGIDRRWKWQSCLPEADLGWRGAVAIGEGMASERPTMMPEALMLRRWDRSVGCPERTSMSLFDSGGFA